MPNIYTPGSLLYPSGSETALVLSASGTTQLGNVNLNNLTSIYSNGYYATVQAPTAVNIAASGYAAGQAHFPIFMNENSYPVLFRNGGAGGQEATLEKVFGPGANGRMSLLATGSGSGAGGTYTASGGLWSYEGEGAIVQPVSLSFASSGLRWISTGGSNANAAISQSLQMGCWVNGFSGVYLDIDASSVLHAYPWQVSADGLTQIRGNATTLVNFTGSSMQSLFVSPASSASGSAVACWFNVTANRIEGCVLTVTTSGGIPVVSAGSVANDSTIVGSATGQRPQGFAVAQDGMVGPNQWLCGGAFISPFKWTAEYLTVSGTALTFTASGTIDPGGPTPTAQGYQTLGSPVTGKAFAFGNFGTNTGGVNAASGVSLAYLQVSGTAVTTNFFVSGMFSNPGPNATVTAVTYARIDPSEPGSNILTASYTIGGTVALSYQISVDPTNSQVLSSTTAFKLRSEYDNSLYSLSLPNPGLPYLGAGEYIGGGADYFTHYNQRKYFPAGFAHSNAGAVEDTLPLHDRMWAATTSKALTATLNITAANLMVHRQSRRLAYAYYDTRAGVAAATSLNIQLMEMPKP